jgi:ATP-binding cassette, subfamily F, member 3
VLILDEPTNHLDLESREALEDALCSFPGSLLLVSHDRALLDAVGSRTIAIEDYTLHSYVGGWPEYWRVREERKAAGVTPPAPPAPEPSNGHGKPPAEKPRPVPKPQGPSKNAQRRQTELEKAVEQTEAALAALEDDLADPAAWATKYESAKSTARHTAAKRAVEEAYAALAEHEEKAPAG